MLRSWFRFWPPDSFWEPRIEIVAAQHIGFLGPLNWKRDRKTIGTLVTSSHSRATTRGSESENSSDGSSFSPGFESTWALCSNFNVSDHGYLLPIAWLRTPALLLLQRRPRCPNAHVWIIIQLEHGNSQISGDNNPFSRFRTSGGLKNDPPLHLLKWVKMCSIMPVFVILMMAL